MGWVTVRERRDPRFWGPIAVFIAVLVALQIWFSSWFDKQLADLGALARQDPDAAARSAGILFTAVGWVGCFVFLALGAYLYWNFRLGRRQRRMPPSGFWSLGAYRVAVGDTAERIGRIGQPLSLAIALCGPAFLLFMRDLASSIAAKLAA